ncbi:hypothetical protein PVAP13_3NG055470 [Panicum virgatum]|uniref:Uncharacterized protein n=1 Tax=Panicum virgatum TaxID=38727 RepID=A0A8T0U3W3_PANVG|nr:hypothetical protein PVAP13_3NG055470 [Panicum virgatum]
MPVRAFQMRGSKTRNCHCRICCLHSLTAVCLLPWLVLVAIVRCYTTWTERTELDQSGSNSAIQFMKLLFSCPCSGTRSAGLKRHGGKHKVQISSTGDFETDNLFPTNTVTRRAISYSTDVSKDLSNLCPKSQMSDTGIK